MREAELNLETQEIQGIIISGYKHLLYSRYLFIHIDNPPQTKAWLQELVEMKKIITSNWENPDGIIEKPDPAINIAFTHTGLKELGLPQDSLDTFPTEFIKGMAQPDRSRQLGDVGDNDPENWEEPWKRDSKKRIDILLILQASKSNDLDQLSQSYENELKNQNIGTVVTVEAGYLREDGKEHFGFRDSISQPIIQGSPKPQVYNHQTYSQDSVKPGEFILGYPNELSSPHKAHLPPTPTVPATMVGATALPLVPHHDNSTIDIRDLGRNGSYLVFRKLHQDVNAFCEYFQSRFPDREEQKRMEAKVVGRWHSGVPLVLSPEQDPCPNPATDPLIESEAKDGCISNTVADNCPDWNGKLNDFSFMPTDAMGYGCPIGAHIRRANPRDGLGDDPQTSINSVKRHRIMRRGALYDYENTYKNDNGNEPEGDQLKKEGRGLLFICINADIRRQFEFIQQSWIHSASFNDLYGERDPLIGTRDSKTCQMTIPQEPWRQKLKDLTTFVKVRGGDYFFLPSISALRFLSGLPELVQPEQD